MPLLLFCLITQSGNSCRRKADRNTIDPISEQTDSRYTFSSDRRILTISNLTLEDTGQYTLTVSNEAGEDSYTISLSVRSKYTPVVISNSDWHCLFGIDHHILLHLHVQTQPSQSGPHPPRPEPASTSSSVHANSRHSCICEGGIN